MGASSSVIREGITINNKILDVNGKIYKQLKCGCIYCSEYKNLKPYNIELALPCYYCNENLRGTGDEKFNIENVKKMLELLLTSNMENLLTEKNGWLTQDEAINYANTKRISVLELISSPYILKKHGFKIN
jgi:hypothetical protein